jgi:hypothetical protein
MRMTRPESPQFILTVVLERMSATGDQETITTASRGVAFSSESDPKPTSAVHSALPLGQVVFRCPYHVDGGPDHQLQCVG